MENESILRVMTANDWMKEAENIPSLPVKLRKNGFTYTQILRGVRSFVYAQHYTPNLTYYEVFHLRYSPKLIINGKSYPKRERFPGNEDFGVWAWSCRTYDEAMKIFNKLENKDDLP